MSPLDLDKARAALGPAPSTDDLSKDSRPIERLHNDGMYMSEIESWISNLTNQIHPVFRDENICACRYSDLFYCLDPDYANCPDTIDDVAQAPAIASPYAKDNFMVRAAFQLATMFITHDDTLPFWAGIIEAGANRDEATRTFHVHPRRHLDKSRKEMTLEHIRNLAEHIRFHFKIFEGDVASMGGITYVDTFEDDQEQRKTCAYRNGKAVLEDGDTRFVHIQLNVALMKGFDQSEDEWSRMTINDCRAEIFAMASLIGHEFAHAVMDHFVYKADFTANMFLNEESLAEEGYCWENFVFGGMIHHVKFGSTRPFYLVPWPNLEILERYFKTGFQIDNRHFGTLRNHPWKELLHDEYERFFEQDFWDEPTPATRFKKMWLRPYHECPINAYEHSVYSAGHKVPVEVLAKKRRSSDATMQREREYARRMRRAEPMTRADRWRRHTEKLQERKDEFHDREKDRLNALWKSFVKDFPTDVFLQ